MSKTKIFFPLAIAVFILTEFGWSRNIPPIVSTDWLSQNLGNPKLVILDIRSTEQYRKGHIPGAISAPLAEWTPKSNDLTLELPSDKALADLLGKAGIGDGVSGSVVIVNRVETDFGRADATRVAWTCIVAGLKNVAVLDGGFTKWAKENRAKSMDAVIPQSVVYSGIPDRSSIVSKEYVLGKLGKSIVLDNRLPEDYFGITAKPGHIKGALNLPTPWMFASDGTFKKEADLRAMAAGVLGNVTSKEILVYCGVGGFSSTWWYILTQLLGFRDVKLYDGSMEEWIRDPLAPVSTFSWH